VEQEKTTLTQKSIKTTNNGKKRKQGACEAMSKKLIDSLSRRNVILETKLRNEKENNRVCFRT